ncbi:hypothetical protein, partial [Mycolicibacterium sp.]|uniref:hypothetical protein n=1 Tax=Mycolicibacterium sp. TaxID=2320850 RepID=UPI003D0F4F5A
QELRHESGNGGYRANTGEFIGERGWIYNDPPVPQCEVRFRARLASRGPWPGLLVPEDKVWDDSFLDSYRETLKKYSTRA